MNKFNVIYNIDAQVTIEIEATTKEEALNKADEKLRDLDFGAAEAVDILYKRTEDENGNTIDENENF